MTLTEQAPLLADADTIKADLEWMTARWDELPTPAVFELRALKEGAQTQIAKFAPDWIEDAVSWAEDMNGLGFNIYVVRNPIRHDVSGSAKDADIIAAFFLWADCDDPASTENVRRFDGPKFAASIVTGDQPDKRVHIYWPLQEPCTDLTAWRDMQTRIADHFSSDESVVNPSRIMRLAGTVTYPAKHKRERGYTRFLTTLRTSYSDPRSPVTLDQMGRVFKPVEAATKPTSGALSIDTGGDHKTANDYADILRRARTDGEKHTGVRDLAASLAGAGVQRGMAEAIIRESCPVWDDNVEDLIQSAYSKYYDKGEPPKPSPEAVTKDTHGVITGLRIQSSAEFLSDLEPAVYVVDGVLAKRRCLSLTGYAGHGKTTLALHMAIQVATGGQFGGADCEQGSVLVLAGENPDNVKWQYAAACAAAGVGQELPIHFLPGHFQLSAFMDDLMAKAQQINNLQLVIIDSLQAFFEGENDNGNVEMMEAARRFRALSEIACGPAVVVIAHPAGKRPDKSNIVPRGGSAFGNEFDGNLTVWSEPDGTQTFHHSEKFRGAPFDPLPFVMEERTFDHLKDHKGRLLRLKVSRMQMQIEQANAAQKSETQDRDALMALDGNPRLTIRALAEYLGVSKSTADRVLQGLKDEKLIRRHAKKWVLTDGGKEFLDG